MDTRAIDAFLQRALRGDRTAPTDQETVVMLAEAVGAVKTLIVDISRIANALEKLAEPVDYFDNQPFYRSAPTFR
jgi:hypothetical protein